MQHLDNYTSQKPQPAQKNQLPVQAVQPSTKQQITSAQANVEKITESKNVTTHAIPSTAKPVQVAPTHVIEKQPVPQPQATTTTFVNSEPQVPPAANPLIFARKQQLNSKLQELMVRGLYAFQKPFINTMNFVVTKNPDASHQVRKPN